MRQERKKKKFIQISLPNFAAIKLFRYNFFFFFFISFPPVIITICIRLERTQTKQTCVREHTQKLLNEYSFLISHFWTLNIFWADLSIYDVDNVLKIRIGIGFRWTNVLENVIYFFCDTGICIAH